MYFEPYYSLHKTIFTGLSVFLKLKMVFIWNTHTTFYYNKKKRNVALYVRTLQ